MADFKSLSPIPNSRIVDRHHGQKLHNSPFIVEIGDLLYYHTGENMIITSKENQSSQVLLEPNLAPNEYVWLFGKTSTTQGSKVLGIKGIVKPGPEELDYSLMVYTYDGSQLNRQAIPISRVHAAIVANGRIILAGNIGNQGQASFYDIPEEAIDNYDGNTDFEQYTTTLSNILSPFSFVGVAWYDNRFYFLEWNVDGSYYLFRNNNGSYQRLARLANPLQIRPVQMIEHQGLLIFSGSLGLLCYDKRHLNSVFGGQDMFGDLYSGPDRRITSIASNGYELFVGYQREYGDKNIVQSLRITPVTFGRVTALGCFPAQNKCFSMWAKNAQFEVQEGNYYSIPTLVDSVPSIDLLPYNSRPLHATPLIDGVEAEEEADLFEGYNRDTVNNPHMVLFNGKQYYHTGKTLVEIDLFSEQTRLYDQSGYLGIDEHIWLFGAGNKMFGIIKSASAVDRVIVYEDPELYSVYGLGEYRVTSATIDRQAFDQSKIALGTIRNSDTYWIIFDETELDAGAGYGDGYGDAVDLTQYAVRVSTLTGPTVSIGFIYGNLYGVVDLGNVVELYTYDDAGQQQFTYIATIDSAPEFYPSPMVSLFGKLYFFSNNYLLVFDPQSLSVINTHDTQGSPRALVGRRFSSLATDEHSLFIGYTNRFKGSAIDVWTPEQPQEI